MMDYYITDSSNLLHYILFSFLSFISLIQLKKTNTFLFSNFLIVLNNSFYFKFHTQKNLKIPIY